MPPARKHRQTLSSFIALPVEIRQRIYKHVFHNAVIHIPISTSEFTGAGVQRYDETVRGHTILLSCRACFNEGLALFYSAAAWHLGQNFILRHSVRSAKKVLPKPGFNHVRSILVGELQARQALERIPLDLLTKLERIEIELCSHGRQPNVVVNAEMFDLLFKHCFVNPPARGRRSYDLVLTTVPWRIEKKDGLVQMVNTDTGESRCGRQLVVQVLSTQREEHPPLRALKNPGPPHRGKRRFR